MPTTTRTVFLTDENGNPLIDEQRNMRTLSFSLVQGYSYRLVERASIVSATYAQVVGYSTATGQTITGVENASKFDVGDFGIVQYAISDRNNTIGYVTCEVTAVGTDSLTVNGIGISVAGADGKDGKDGAPGADGKDGAATIQIGTVTTGAAGSQASITNVGTANAAILNFTIPRGDTGAQGVPGENGAPGADGAPGAAATVSVGQVTTLPAGSQATVTNSGDENAAVLNFGIPQGATGQTGANGTNGTDGAPGKDGADGKDGVTFTPSVDTNGNLSWTNDGGLPNPETVNVRGAQGEAATVQVGTTTTLPAGSQATVNNSGTSEAAVLNFGIPKGEAATIEVGTVTTGAAGTQASVTNSGTENAAVLDFTIPQGPQGEKGEDGTIVEANPTATGTVDLEKLQVGGTVYNIPTGGGGGLQSTTLQFQARATLQTIVNSIAAVQSPVSAQVSYQIVDGFINPPYLVGLSASGDPAVGFYADELIFSNNGMFAFKGYLIDFANSSSEFQVGVMIINPSTSKAEVHCSALPNGNPISISLSLSMVSTAFSITVFHQ